MILAMTLGSLLSTPAHACGGFFCNGGGTITTVTTTTSTTTENYLVPVEQNSERILFRMNDDQTVTTYVEVGYQQNSEVDFAWVIPIPAPIEATDVGTLNAEFFNELEALTAPRFTFQWVERNTNTTTFTYGGGAGANTGPRGCSLGCAGSDKSFGGDTGLVIPYDATTGTTTLIEETYGVDVVAEAVVGPFEIQVITALDGQDFADWLTLNGYDMPPGGAAVLQHYVDENMAYLGVKLAPDVPDGPIDTLVFTYPARQPMIPIILTQIASASDLPIIAYILADEMWGPENFDQTRDITAETRPDDFGGTTYLANAAEEIDTHGGHAFMLEFGGQTAGLYTPIPGLANLLSTGVFLTRWRGDLSPDQMTLDPIFEANLDLLPYSAKHLIVFDYAQGDTPIETTPPESVEVREFFKPIPARGDGAWLLLPLPLFLMRRRKNSQKGS